MVQELLQLLNGDTDIYIFSFAVSVLIIGVAAFILAKGERGAATRLIAASLVVGSLLVFAETLVLTSPVNYQLWKRASLSFEGILPVLLFFFSICYVRQFSWSSANPVTRILVALSPVPVFAGVILSPERLYYSPDFFSERMLFLSNQGFAFYIAVFVYLVAALFNIEATFRSALRPDQWQIKFTILGTGTFLGSLVFYYSQSLLYRSINMNLSPFRTLALLISGSMLAYSLRRVRRTVRITLSREMAFRSLVLTIIGGYLLLLGLLGEGLKYFGESSQQVIFVSVFFIGCLLLLVFLLSEQMKRKIKVFISNNFFDNKYDYRVHWLNFTSRLADTRNNAELDSAILSVFCETFAMGGALIFLWAPEQQVYFNRGAYQTDLTGATLSQQHSLIRYMLSNKWVLNSDYCIEEIEEEDLFRISAEKMTFAVPIFMGSELEGFIALLRPINKGEVYSYEDYDLMKTLASQAAFALSSARLSEQLAVAREMEAVGKVTAFIMHDLKNLVYGLSLLTDNAVAYIGEPEFQKDLLDTLGNTVSRMNSLIGRLKELPDKIHLNLGEVNLIAMAIEVVASIPSRDITVTGEKVTAVADQLELSKVITNLLVNALDASSQGDVIDVEVGKNGQAYIRVTDHGSGMTPEYIRGELFSPFKTTKGKGLGIGLYQSRQIVEAHQGHIEVNSTPGAGSVFTVWIPISGPTY